MQTVVIFQGGGPLGAYACGAWSTLAAWLRDGGHRLLAVGGSSIGALNAAVIATRQREPDFGADLLESIWRERIATPSFPFWGMWPGESLLAQRLRAWNAFLTGLLLGNRGLFAPLYLHWNPLAMLRRAHWPLFSQAPMLELLDEVVGAGYASANTDDATLAVAATDIADGELRLFSSDARPIGVRELGASAAIPLLFAPHEVDARVCWDGEAVRRSIVPPLFAALRDSGRLREDEAVQVVTIELASPEVPDLPKTSFELLDRALQLLMLDKLRPEPSVPPTARWLRIVRRATHWDNLSGQLDYSPQRIDALIAQGREDARQALAAA